MTRKYSAAASSSFPRPWSPLRLSRPHESKQCRHLRRPPPSATTDRAELYKQVISSVQFKLFLELEPS